MDYLAKQAAEEKRISPVAASPGMSLTLSELETYNGTTNGKPILVSVLGNIYDVGTGAGLYGVGRQYRAFAGKDITRCACAKFNKSAAALGGTKWLNLTREGFALLRDRGAASRPSTRAWDKVSDREARAVARGGGRGDAGGRLLRRPRGRCSRRDTSVDTKAPAFRSAPHPATKGPPPF